MKEYNKTCCRYKYAAGFFLIPNDNHFDLVIISYAISPLDLSVFVVSQPFMNLVHLIHHHFITFWRKDVKQQIFTTNSFGLEHKQRLNTRVRKYTLSFQISY